jgi:hypothetical protein
MFKRKIFTKKINKEGKQTRNPPKQKKQTENNKEK